jgi:peptidoglycan/xylan/chitin deacetylase (PgdA/CDA1 family)
MRWDRAVSVRVVRPLLQSGLLRPAAAVPILMYHSISEDPEPGVSPYYRLATSPARFRDHMRWLREDGYSVVGLSEAVRRVSTSPARDARFAVVTFDDGFRDFLTHAVPTLLDFGYKATMFLPTAFIGQARLSFKGRECLTWAEVRELQKWGMSFGAHTVTHPVLSRQPWSDVQHELRESRARIEAELHTAAESFAYPFAFPQEDRAFVSRLRQVLAEQGYAAGVTTMIGRACRRADPLCLPRVPVNDCDDRQLLLAKLAGAYDWAGTIQGAFRRAKRRYSTLRYVWSVPQRPSAT